MISPQFPFSKNQIILSSDRIVLHSKSDAIFLFGKGAVSLSSPNTVNIDAEEKVAVFSPRIELGSAPAFMEPTMKGRTFSVQMALFLDALIKAFEPLTKISGGDPPQGCEKLVKAVTELRGSAQKVIELSKPLKNICETPDSDSAILSKNTFVS